MVAGHVLDDRQPQAGAAGAAGPRLVDPVEALEHPQPVLARDADAAVGDRDLGEPGPGAGGDRDAGLPRAVGDGVGQQVGDGGGQLALDAADDEALLHRRRRCSSCLARGGRPGAVDRLGEHGVDVDRLELGQRLAALQPGQVDQLAHEPAEPVGLVRHPAGEALHRLGVVGGALDRLGEQRQRADRRLQLVPDVGDEVAAHRLDPAGLGDVLQHERDRSRRRRRAAAQPHAVHAEQPRPGAGEVAGQPDVGAPAARGRAPPARARRSSGTSSRLPRTMPRARAAGLARSTASSTSDEDDGGVHQVQQPPGQRRLGQARTPAAGVGRRRGRCGSGG